MKVIVIGGGPAGFSAAMVARKVGAEVTVLERSDALGGFGQVAGVGMPGTAVPIYTEERALGGADLAGIFEAIATHRNITVPGVGENVTLYNVTKLDASMQKALKAAGVEVMLRKPVIDAAMTNGKVEAVILQDGSSIAADAFVDATGAIEGTTACVELGRGCVDCCMKCPAYGAPCGIADKRAKTVARLNAYGKPGVIGTSVLIPIASLSPKLQKEVTEQGYAVIPAPPGVTIDTDRMKRAGMPEMFKHPIHKDNLIVVDVGGFAKSLAAGGPMFAGSLRSFPGLEESSVMHPLAGTMGHLVSWTTMAYHDNTMKAEGFDNLFVGGHKAGPMLALADAVTTGDLAGYNAVRQGLGKQCLELPRTLMTGAFFDHVGKQMRTEEGLRRGYGIIEVEILKELGVYRDKKADIEAAVEKAGLAGVYRTRLC